MRERTLQGIWDGSRGSPGRLAYAFATRTHHGVRRSGLPGGFGGRGTCRGGSSPGRAWAGAASVPPRGRSSGWGRARWSWARAEDRPLAVLAHRDLVEPVPDPRGTPCARHDDPGRNRFRVSTISSRPSSGKSCASSRRRRGIGGTNGGTTDLLAVFEATLKPATP
jgi:hypothetical protein